MLKIPISSEAWRDQHSPRFAATWHKFQSSGDIARNQAGLAKTMLQHKVFVSTSHCA